MTCEILKHMCSTPTGEQFFKVGQNVRVISRIDCNMPKELSHWLNSVCEVVRVIPRGLISREWSYELRHANGATCEFKVEELDLRYRIRKYN